MITNFKIFEELDFLKPTISPEYYKDGKLIAYHVTNEKNIKKIKKEGLIPNMPADFGERGDLIGVYLFKTWDDMDNALMNWFGERIEEWEEENDKEFKETCLTIDLTGLEDELYDSVEYEWTCKITITPDRIINLVKLY